MMRRFALFLIGCGLTLVVMLLSAELSRPAVSLAQAPDTDSGIQLPDGVTITGDNSFCVLCHSSARESTPLADGSTLNLQVDQLALSSSVHASTDGHPALGCLDCHGEGTFPHKQNLSEVPDARTFQLQTTDQICTKCHTDQAEGQAHSVHGNALAMGKTEAATCTDCHGAHNVSRIKDFPAIAAQTCGNCHTEVFAQYKDSIHGQAVLINSDYNAPTCIDCHGVHKIDDPTTVQARNRSPELCASCHADEKLMKQYDISTNVFNSYVTEFHGSTVALFNQEDPNVATNKAVCYDCHGVHNITPADNEKSNVAKQNLLATCQQCHPDGSANFPDAWVGHFEPTADKNPLLFAVNQFYQLLIPSVLGGFGILVVSDIFGQLSRWLRGGKK